MIVTIVTVGVRTRFKGCIQCINKDPKPNPHPKYRLGPEYGQLDSSKITVRFTD